MVRKIFSNRRSKTPRVTIVIITLILIVSAVYVWIKSNNTILMQDLGIMQEFASTTDPANTTVSSQRTTPTRMRTSSTVVAIAQTISGTSQFNALFKSTGTAASTTGKGPYTIFVPTNGAFNQLPAGTISKMTPAQKLRFIQYHVIVGRAIDSEAQIAGTIQALSGDMLNFSFGADQIPLVNSAIFIQKYQASNGVVYLIDNVLLPPQRF